MYLYETHLHTAPMSACAEVGVRETLEYYKSAGYAGVFITNHFLDGNISKEVRTLPYAEAITRYFAVCEEGRAIGEELGIAVFPGLEMSYKGTDFLVYGLDVDWWLAHEENIKEMKKSALLRLLMDEGALVIQAHPFREARYIDHIRLFPRCVHGVEVFNACRTVFENAMAEEYAENYKLLSFAGSDNHMGGKQPVFGGVATDEPIKDVRHFVDLVLSGEAKLFVKDEKGVRIL